MKKVLVISTSLRGTSNSHELAKAFAKGAEEAGNQVELITLHHKEIKFCIGCLKCQETGKCVISDDVPEIMAKLHDADVVCFATPIYYYEMCGQRGRGHARGARTRHIGPQRLDRVLRAGTLCRRCVCRWRDSTRRDQWSPELGKGLRDGPERLTDMRALFLTFLIISGIMAHSQNKLYVTANGETRTATLADNEATEALIGLLADGPVTVSMHDYGGWEKVGDLPRSLPTSNTQIKARPGDIMLYQGYQMVIFYGDNSWSYTRLGRIDGATASNLRSWLGNGSVDVTLSLSASSGIDGVTVDKNTKDKVYDLMGRPVTRRPLLPGIYIINGNKTAIR